MSSLPSRSTIVGDSAVFTVRGDSAGSPGHKTIVVFCGKGADCYNAVPQHPVTMNAVNAAEETSDTYFFLSMKQDALEFSETTCTTEYQKERTQSMINAVKSLGISPDAIKLFSYGASFPDIVSAAFDNDVRLDIYGSGKSFGEDLSGVSQKQVRVFKSTGDQYSPYAALDNDHPSPIFKFDDTHSKYRRAALVAFEDGPLDEAERGNFLIIQQDRATVIQKKRFGDLLCTHADLGGEFLVKV